MLLGANVPVFFTTLYKRAINSTIIADGKNTSKTVKHHRNVQVNDGLSRTSDTKPRLAKMPMRKARPE